MTDLHSQASEEATDWRADYPPEVVTEALDLAAMLALHVPPEFPPSELARRLALPLDRVSRERTRLALERAATAIADRAASLKYEGEPCNCPDACVHEAFDSAEAEVRALLSDGESVASEEKEGR